MTSSATNTGRHCDAWNARRLRIAKLALVLCGLCIAPLWWFWLDGRAPSAIGTFVGLAIVAFCAAVFFSRREVCPACRRARAARPNGSTSTTDVV